MIIHWEKIAQTREATIAADYIENKVEILDKLLAVYMQEKLLTMSFTPKPLQGKYYTYEIKYHHHDDKYLINVWNGIRTGDALPVLYGYLQPEIENKKRNKKSIC